MVVLNWSAPAGAGIGKPCARATSNATATSAKPRLAAYWLTSGSNAAMPSGVKCREMKQMADYIHPVRECLLSLHMVGESFIGNFSDGNPHAAKAEQAIFDAFAPVRRAVVWEEEHNPDGSMLTSGQVEEANYHLRRDLDPEFRRQEEELDAKFEEYMRKKHQQEGNADD
jgi:hypothetical protein